MKNFVQPLVKKDSKRPKTGATTQLDTKLTHSHPLNL